MTIMKVGGQGETIRTKGYRVPVSSVCYRFRLESICREIFCDRIYFNALISASQISIDPRSCFSST